MGSNASRFPLAAGMPVHLPTTDSALPRFHPAVRNDRPSWMRARSGTIRRIGHQFEPPRPNRPVRIAPNETTQSKRPSRSGPPRISRPSMTVGVQTRGPLRQVHWRAEFDPPASGRLAVTVSASPGPVEGPQAVPASQEPAASAVDRIPQQGAHAIRQSGSIRHEHGRRAGLGTRLEQEGFA